MTRKTLSLISRFNLKTVLNDSVLHFVPLPNPDGFDLVKKGLSSVQTSNALSAIKSVGDTSNSNYKANLRGVDLNRNFPSVHFNLDKKQWEDIWGKYPSWQDRSVPGGEFYSGPNPASEVETKALMAYLIRYDFRQYLTFHSRGNLTYWHKYFYTAPYNNQTNKFANIINSVNGYTVAGLSNGKGSGFFSDYTAGMTCKPTVTVETTWAGSVLPTPRSSYSGVYNNIKHLPLYLREEGEKTGYHDYKLYRDGKYVRDYLVKNYGDAGAKKCGGYIIKYSEKPHHIDPTLPVPDPEPDFPVEDYRIWGSDRYSTAAKIALKKYDHADTVIIAGGYALVDSLVAGPLAHRDGHPILLVNKELTEETIKIIEDFEIENIIILGGSAVVSNVVEEQLNSMVNGGVTRVSGADRYATSIAVAENFFQDTGEILIVNGYSFVDAVAGSILETPMIYTDKDRLRSTAISMIQQKDHFHVLGGRAVISNKVLIEAYGILHQ